MYFCETNPPVNYRFYRYLGRRPSESGRVCFCDRGDGKVMMATSFPSSEFGMVEGHLIPPEWSQLPKRILLSEAIEIVLRPHELPCTLSRCGPGTGGRSGSFSRHGWHCGAGGRGVSTGARD